MDEKTNFQRITELSKDMLGKERIIIYGLLAIEVSILGVLSYLVARPNTEAKLVEKTMDYFFNVGFIIIGALVNSVQHKDEPKS